jgi:hypothetical protein
MKNGNGLSRKERQERREKAYLVFSGKTPSFVFFASFAVSLCLSWPQASRAEAPAGLPFTCIYDTGARSDKPLSTEAVAARTGWVRLAEGDLNHPFKGDAVLANDALTVVFRQETLGPDVYTKTESGQALRATLYECGEGIHAAQGLSGVRLTENGTAAVALDAQFARAAGRTARVVFRMTAGQPWIEVRTAEAGAVLCTQAAARYVVVPDFFGEDMVFFAQAFKPGSRAVPAENCLLSLLEGGSAMILCVWQSSTRAAEVVAGYGGDDASIGMPAVYPAKDKAVWFAFIEAPGLWHERPVKFADEGTTVALDWKPPFPAKWRADLVHPDHTADSWFFRAADEKDAAAPDSPCRLDGNRATVAIPPPAAPQPGVDPRVGPLIVYPLDRSRATPLTTFTPVDVLRNTLGMGPCQYILETEGLATQENPTPEEVMAWVEKQFKKKGGKDAADEIRERLKAMTEHVARARVRLKAYHDFALSAGALVRVMGTSPEAARAAEETAFTFARIQKAAEDGLAATQPERLAKSADALAAVIGREDAAAQAERPAADIRTVGAAVDRALARCRMAVRWVSIQVAETAAKDDPEAAKAKQVRALAEQLLQAK